VKDCPVEQARKKNKKNLDSREPAKGVHSTLSICTGSSMTNDPHLKSTGKTSLALI
jgi:hypothetical protein